MNKTTRMYKTFLWLNGLSANTKSYDMFLNAIQDYETFREIERRTEEC